jgi:hypothetical protein
MVILCFNLYRAAPIFDDLLAGYLTLEKLEFEVPNSRMSDVMNTTQSLANLYDPTFFRFSIQTFVFCTNCNNSFCHFVFVIPSKLKTSADVRLFET